MVKIFKYAVCYFDPIDWLALIFCTVGIAIKGYGSVFVEIGTVKELRVCP